MMRGVLRSLFVVGLMGGMAFAGDPMPAEQAADPKPADAKPADSKFETVKRDAPTEGPIAGEKHAKKAKHKKARKAPKHKKAHRKAKRA